MSLLPQLIDTIELERLDELEFRGNSLFIGSPRVYGGQVIAQILHAANQTVPLDRWLHSFHGYFLSPGDVEKPIRFEVEKIKDGRSFSSRRILAKQGDRTIFLSSASYHIFEDGVSHQQSMPNVAQPESLSSFSELFQQFAEKSKVKPRGIFSEESPIIFHPVEHYDPFNPGIKPPLNHTWFKLNGNASSDIRVQKTLLAYMSDFNLLITSLMPHDMSMFTTPVNLASLDHAMWFHRPFDMNEWMLYVVECPSAGNARGFCTGKIFTRTGDLVASVTQEGLIRIIE